MPIDLSRRDEIAAAVAAYDRDHPDAPLPRNAGRLLPVMLEEHRTRGRRVGRSHRTQWSGDHDGEGCAHRPSWSRKDEVRKGTAVLGVV